MPTDLAEICTQCKAQYEQSIDNLLKINQELQQENKQLKNRPSPPTLTYDQQYLIDLCGQMAEAWRHKFDVLLPGIQEIIKAWDKVNEGQEKEHD